jgi:hypothetical protein
MKLSFIAIYKDANRVQLMVHHPQMRDPNFVPPDVDNSPGAPLIDDPAFTPVLTNVTVQVAPDAIPGLKLGDHVIGEFSLAPVQPDYGGVPAGNHLTNKIVGEGESKQVVHHVHEHVAPPLDAPAPAVP